MEPFKDILVICTDWQRRYFYSVWIWMQQENAESWRQTECSAITGGGHCQEKLLGVFYCRFMVAVYPPRGMGESRGSSQHM